MDLGPGLHNRNNSLRLHGCLMCLVLADAKLHKSLFTTS